MQRKFDPAVPELMDRPQPVTPELESDLRNIRQLNRYFGSYALIEHFLRRWIQPSAQLRVLDLATGSGDIPRLVIDYARKVNATVTVDAIDQQESTLKIARDLSADYPEIDFKTGAVLSFGCSRGPAVAGSPRRDDETYDIVLCSLALHHFEEAAAVQLLKRCRELSRRYVLVSDLRRGLLATVGAYLLTAFIFRDPMTRTDARRSAARAFSFREFRTLAERALARQVLQPDHLATEQHVEEDADDIMANAINPVHLDLPEGAKPGENRQYLAGNIALFGLRRASMKDGQHAGEGLTFILDATPVIDQLHLKNEFDVESLQVSVIPADPLPENADITVGRISIYREGF